MRRVLAMLAALSLSACGYFIVREAEVHEVPVSEEGTAEEGVMAEDRGPTEEEAAAMRAEAQQRAEEGVVYAGAALKGGAVTLAAGETLRIELESVPTAGYVWEIIRQPDFLDLIGEGMRPTDPAWQTQQGYTGGNHYLSFDLKAVSAGIGVIELVERRPWETDEPPMDTYSLTVTATAGE